MKPKLMTTKEHRRLLKNDLTIFPRLAKILAGGAYRGNLADWVLDKFGWDMEVRLKSNECPIKFRVIPKQ